MLHAPRRESRRSLERFRRQSRARNFKIIRLKRSRAATCALLDYPAGNFGKLRKMDKGVMGVRTQISRFVSVGLLGLLASCGGGGGSSESSPNPPPPPVADTTPTAFTFAA